MSQLNFCLFAYSKLSQTLGWSQWMTDCKLYKIWKFGVFRFDLCGVMQNPEIFQVEFYIRSKQFAAIGVQISLWSQRYPYTITVFNF